MRILIADEHPVVRRGLKDILHEEFNGVQFGEANDFPETLQLIKEKTWDILILDIVMNGGKGLDFILKIKTLRPNLPILVLSTSTEEQYAIRSLQAGAAGYLTKDSAPNELFTAVHNVLAGRNYISQNLAEKLANHLQQKHPFHPHESLSNREFEILVMLAQGKKLTEIAAELALSVKTISTYRTRILDKMHLTSNAELIRYALQNRLID